MPTVDAYSDSAIKLDLKVPAVVTADTAEAGKDITDYKGKCMVVAAITKNSGTATTADVAIQACNDSDIIGTIGYAGTGNGTITEVEGGPDAVAEDITVTFSNGTTAAVVGSVSGSLGSATVGTKFVHAKISFMLTAGSVAFVNLDAFTVTVTAARTYTTVLSFTQVVATNIIEKKTLNIDSLGRFIRAYTDVSATGTPNYTVGVSLYGLKN